MDDQLKIDGMKADLETAEAELQAKTAELDKLRQELDALRHDNEVCHVWILAVMLTKCCSLNATALDRIRNACILGYWFTAKLPLFS